MPRRCAASTGEIRDRGSLAPLPAPATTRPIPPGAGIPAIVAPLRARETKSHHDGAAPPRGIVMERIMQDVISTETSQTAMACQKAALFGATPGPDEFDNREIWNEEEALAGIEEAIHILAGAVAPDGTQLADERESLLWGFVNALHALGPAPRPRYRQDRAPDERPRPRTGRLRDEVPGT